MAVEVSAELLSTVARVLGGSFGELAPVFIDLLTLFAQPSRPESERSMCIGTLSEIIEAMVGSVSAHLHMHVLHVDVSGPFPCSPLGEFRGATSRPPSAGVFPCTSRSQHRGVFFLPRRHPPSSLSEMLPPPPYPFSQVRSNGAYGIGLLCQYGGGAVAPHLDLVLSSLYSNCLHAGPEFVRARDNACSAVSRILVAHTATVNVDQVREEQTTPKTL